MLRFTEFINNKSILGILRRSCNYVDSRLIDHGYRVAHIASRILKKKGGFDERMMRDVCFLALLHDVGAYKTEEISRMVQFETENVWNHSIYGYLFIKYFSPLSGMAPAILHHHTAWQSLKEEDKVSNENKEIAQILHIADRIDIYMWAGHDWESVKPVLKNMSGKSFAPWAVDLALQLELGDYIETKSEIDERLNSIFWNPAFTSEELISYIQMIIFTIDFRSRHTVTHTITTTSISYELGRLMGLSQLDQNQIVCGALLHDLGKIGIPVEILEYPGKLSPQAMKIMRTHVEITERIFGGEIDEAIQKIALRHHEKLDGSGYPRGLRQEELSAADRIVAVADIVSALAGTRSYKEAYSKERIVGIISGMRDEGLIDAAIVNKFIEHYDEILQLTRERTQPILDIYHDIQEEFQNLTETCGQASTLSMF